jgi:thioredoxin 1
MLDDGRGNLMMSFQRVGKNIMAVHKFTDQSFEADVLKSSTLTLVDFWAEWCGPCRVIGPVLDSVAEELGDTVKIGKINIDENSDVPARYNVRSIPTLVLFKNGQPVATQVGALPRNVLLEWLKEHQ